MASPAPASSPAQLVNGAAVSSKETFRRVYDLLKKPLLEDSEVFSYTAESREWIEKMLDYNVPKGKLNRGLSVVDSLILLRSGEKLSEDDTFLACALGWCIEWLQAYFLVLDDIMDGSETRRGQPCWYKTLMPGSKINKVDLVAVNDGILLRNHIPQILKRYFRHKPYYLELRELFDEIEYQTACGQMLDLITTPQGEVDLSKYVMETYSRIVQFKTAYYSFYLPVACALHMAGEQDKAKFDSAKSILVRMGTYFQIQDDYLDCYGNPEVIGKIGTDIQDTKCSWLVVQAIARATPEQKQRILSNYGKKDDVAVAEVKKIYGELNLEKVYRDYEQASYDELIEEIDKEESVELQHVLKSFLAKIYKRKN